MCPFLGPLGLPFDPLGPCRPILDPLGPCRPIPGLPENQWAHPLTPWDPEGLLLDPVSDPIGLPLDPLGPCKPTP